MKFHESVFLCPESQRQKSARAPLQRHERGLQGRRGRRRKRGGCIIKNRENRRTVSRVVVRALTKLDYFSQLLPYLLRPPRLPSLHLSLSCSAFFPFCYFLLSYFFLHRLRRFYANLSASHVDTINILFLSHATVFVDLH